MAGNKHKNGIICVFPGCEKKMRTQKFKGHFVKVHLREGEAYTIEHRRQFEMARTDSLSDGDAGSVSSTGSLGDGRGIPRPVKTETAKPQRGDLQSARKTVEMAMGIVSGAMVATEPQSAIPAVVSNTAQTAVSAVTTSTVSGTRCKRSAAAMTSDASSVSAGINGEPPVDNAVLAQVLLLIDRRFNELSSKMDAVLESHRRVLAALPTPFSPTESIATPDGPPGSSAKKRKETTPSISESTTISSSSAGSSAPLDLPL